MYTSENLLFIRLASLFILSIILKIMIEYIIALYNDYPYEGTQRTDKSLLKF
jgi:hypothetical protein